MTVKELIEKLQKCPGDMKVITCQGEYGWTESVYIDLADNVVVITEEDPESFTEETEKIDNLHLII